MSKTKFHTHISSKKVLRSIACEIMEFCSLIKYISPRHIVWLKLVSRNTEHAKRLLFISLAISTARYQSYCIDKGIDWRIWCQVQYRLQSNETVLGKVHWDQQRKRRRVCIRTACGYNKLFTAFWNKLYLTYKTNVIIMQGSTLPEPMISVFSHIRS